MGFFLRKASDSGVGIVESSAIEWRGKVCRKRYTSGGAVVVVLEVMEGECQD